MPKAANAIHTSRLHTQNLADAAWRGQQAQVDADVAGLSCDADAGRLVAEMDALGLNPASRSYV
jgi:predicted transcriptional regulator